MTACSDRPCARRTERWSFLALLVYAASLLTADDLLAADRFRIDPDHTFAHFAVVHTGVSSVRGRVGISNGSASLEADQQIADVKLELDLRTLDTGVRRLDALLIGEMFFDAAKFRTATFSARSSFFAEGVPVQFDGELTIKGVTRPVQLVADRFVCQEVSILALKRFVCGGDLSATVKRSDFGLTKYLSMVSDEVRISVSVEAIRENR